MLSDGGVDDITKALADFSQTRVEVLDTSGETLFTAGPSASVLPSRCGGDSFFEKELTVNNFPPRHLSVRKLQASCPLIFIFFSTADPYNSAVGRQNRRKK